MSECRRGTGLQWRGRKLGVPSKHLREFYAANIGPIPEGFHVRHLCGNPWCVLPEHLAALPPLTKLGAPV